MSKGASRAPQEIRILFAVLPVACCQGLFMFLLIFSLHLYIIYKKFAFLKIVWEANTKRKVTIPKHVRVVFAWLAVT